MAKKQPVNLPNGGLNGHTDRHEEEIRLPSLLDLLSISPFSSIIPFDPNVIPLPRLAQIPFGASFAQAGGTEDGSAVLTSLNNLGIDDPACQPFLEARDRLKALIRPQVQSQYNFKMPKQTRSRYKHASSGDMRNPKTPQSLGALSQCLVQAETGSYKLAATPPSKAGVSVHKPMESAHALSESYGSRGGHVNGHVDTSSARVTQSVGVTVRSTLPPSPANPAYLSSLRHSDAPSKASISIDLRSRIHQNGLDAALPVNSTVQSASRIVPSLVPPPQLPQTDAGAPHEGIQGIIVPPSPSRKDPTAPVTPHLTSRTQSRVLETPTRKLLPQVVLSRTPTIRDVDYVAFPDHDAQFTVQRVSELADLTKEILNPRAKQEYIRGHREDAQRNCKEFEELVEQIVRASREVPDDHSTGTLGINASRFFDSDLSPGDEGPCLNFDTLKQLKDLLRKIGSEPEFSAIDIEFLLQIQRIASHSLQAAAEAQATFSTRIGEQTSVADWQQYSHAVENAFRSAQLLLRLLQAQRQDRQLFSEDNVMAIVRVCSIFVTDLSKVFTVDGQKESSPDIWTDEEARDSTITAMSELRMTLLLAVRLVAAQSLGEDILGQLEYLTLEIVFLERSWMMKRSGSAGIRSFEALKNAASDLLVSIVIHAPSQRDSLCTQVIANLGSLQSARNTSRQLRLANGSNIQLVSALLMRLVQASALVLDEVKVPKQEYQADDHGLKMNGSNPTKTGDETQSAVRELKAVVDRVQDSVQNTARRIVNHIFSQALNSTKSSDAPYRNLLESLVQDLGSALSTPGWPGSEVLLRVILSQAIVIVESERSGASAKAMALDLLGSAGNAITQLTAAMHQSTAHLESKGDNVTRRLLGYGNELGKDMLDDPRSISVEGPFMMYHRYRTDHSRKGRSEDDVAALFMLAWSQRSLEIIDNGGNQAAHQQMTLEEHRELAGHLVFGMRNPNIRADDSQFHVIGADEGRAAYLLAMLQLPFCRAFERILLVLLSSTNVEQTTVRSKSLRMLQDLLVQNPAILDRGSLLLRHILNRTTDQSPMVRQSVVNLLAKCQSLRPGLRLKILPSIIDRTVDTVIGVRKPAVKMLKEIYATSTKAEVKHRIIEALLARVRDQDQGVSDLASQVLDEAWLAPIAALYAQNTGAMQLKVTIRQVGRVIVQTAEVNDSLSTHLLTYFRAVLSSRSQDPSSSTNKRVIKSLVAGLLDDAIEDQENADGPTQAAIFRTLTIFARAEAGLFTLEQLQLLKPHIDNVTRTDNLTMYRAVIIIFRCVLPTFTHIQEPFLRSVQATLLNSLTKLGKRELKEVIPCLWTINKVLKNVERLERTAASCLKELYRLRADDLSNDTKKRGSVMRYIPIVSLLGKVCSFQSDLAAFEQGLPQSKGETVAGLMTKVVSSFCNNSHPVAVRRAAVEGLGWICYGNPILFSQETVMVIYKGVFRDSDVEFENIVLGAFLEYLSMDEQFSDPPIKEEGESTEARDTAVLVGAITANKEEGIASSLAHTYLRDIIRIALAAQDEHSTLAVEVIASIYRQGLAHPKECGPILGALTTSSNPLICEVATRDYHSLYPKYESLLERESGKTVELACTYLNDVIRTDDGLIDQATGPRLRALWEILRGGKLKPRKKFLQSCVQHAVRGLIGGGECSPQQQICHAQFLMENLALLEYGTIDELLETVQALEKQVTTTGPLLIERIHQTHPALSTPMTEHSEPGVNGAHDHTEPLPPIASAASSSDLQSQTASSATILLMWSTRSHLRRLYSLSTHKPATKDLARAPSRTPGITPDRFRTETSTILAALKRNDERTLYTLLNDLLETDVEHEVNPDEDDSDAEGASASAEPGLLDSHSRDGSSSLDGRVIRPAVGSRKVSSMANLNIGGGAAAAAAGSPESMASKGGERGKKRRAKGPATPSKRAKSAARPVVRRRASTKGAKGAEDKDGDYGG